MPPKTKTKPIPIPTEAATKKESAAAAGIPPPQPLKAEDPLTVSYYADGVYDYADVVFRVHRTMQKGEYEVRLAKDGLLVLFRRAICSRSFNKKILRKIMGEEYRESSARVVAWDDTALEMQQKQVRPKNGLFWGETQVVRLRWKCTGTPTAVNKHDYPTEYKVKDKKGEWHVQCDCIVLVTVKKAEERTQAEVEVESRYADLFGTDSSQESQRSDDPPSPPPPRRKKREERNGFWRLEFKFGMTYHRTKLFIGNVNREIKETLV